MFSLFDKIYSAVKRKRAITIVLLLVIIGLSINSIRKLNFIDDFTKVFPFREETRVFNDVLSNSDFLNRLIFNISLEDSSDCSTQDIIAFTCEFLDSMNTLFIPRYIEKLYFKADEHMMDDMFDVFYNHLPLYMTRDDYEKLDSLMLGNRMEDRMFSNFKLLMSPSGMVVGRYIIKDPVQLVMPKLKILQDVQVDKSLTLYNSYFFTQDHKNLLFFALPSDLNNTKKNTQFIDELDDLIHDFKSRYTSINVSYYGATAIAVANAVRIKNDIKLTITVVLILIILWLGAYFRNARAVIIIFIPVVIGGLIGLGFLTLFTEGISMLSIAIGSVLIGISVDYSLHFLTHFKQTNSLRDTLKYVSGPVLMSSLTTGTAFLCLVFLSSQILRDLGIFASISIFTASLAALIIVPQLLKTKKQAANKLRTSFVERIAAYPFDQKKYVILIVLIITFILLPFISKVDFEGDLEKSNYLNQKLKEAEHKIKSTNDISKPIVFLFSSGDNLNNALIQLEKAIPSVKEQVKDKKIGEVFTLYNILPSEARQQKQIALWDEYWTQEKKKIFTDKLVAAGLRYSFKENAFQSFLSIINKEYEVVEATKLYEKFEHLISNFIIPVGDSVMVTSLVKISDLSKKNVVYEVVSDYKGTNAFDKKFIAESLFEYLKNDLSKLITYSLIVVFVILLLFFGRIELAVVTFLPMLISYGWTLGIMGISGIKFNIFNIIVSTFIFGLGIDYSIFITKGLLNEYKTGKKDIISFKTSILLSSITTLMGIGVLIFAKHPALKSIALLSIIGISSVVLISFTVQPMLVRLVVPLTAIKGRKIPLSLLILTLSTIAFLSFAFTSVFITLLVPFIYILPFHFRKRRLILHYIICIMNRLLLKINLHVKDRKINFDPKIFDEPSVVIVNHQSVVDLLIVIGISPKIVIMVKDWVWNNFFFGIIVRFAGYINVSEGYDTYLPKLKQRIDEGYSILVFPEGSRSRDGKIRRFHKGAFFMARELKLPILPVVLHGVFDSLPPGRFIVAHGTMTMKILPKIDLYSGEHGNTYQENTKSILKYFRAEHQKMKTENENTEYFKQRLMNNYMFKGPVIENYQRLKLYLDKYYAEFHRLIPVDARVYDLGCGMGAMTLMLSYTGNNRIITGIDYDEDKIEIAKNCIYDINKINFISEDVLKFDYEQADAFILSDVLHYLPKENQGTLLNKCIDKLKNNGIIVIRDGNINVKSKHGMTKLSEFLSTNIGFNKAKNKLSFISDDWLNEVAKEKKLEFDIISSSRYTSNQIYVLRKTPDEVQSK